MFSCFLAIPLEQEFKKDNYDIHEKEYPFLL